MTSRRSLLWLLVLSLACLSPAEAATKKKRPASSSTPAKKPVARSSATPVPSPQPTSSPSPTAAKASPSPTATNATLSTDELLNFNKQPPKVQRLIESALALTRQNLGYQFGSADPANGGVDCSGFIYHLLRENGIDDVPRQSNEQYAWVRKADLFQAVLGRKSSTFELDELEPGDLLFWTGTYDVQRDPPITHTMIYLGMQKRGKKRVMVGASDGRSYDGVRRFGVSVFDFKVETARVAPDKMQPRFVGYAHIPGLRD